MVGGTPLHMFLLCLQSTLLCSLQSSLLGKTWSFHGNKSYQLRMEAEMVSNTHGFCLQLIWLVTWDIIAIWQSSVINIAWQTALGHSRSEYNITYLNTNLSLLGK